MKEVVFAQVERQSPREPQWEFSSFGTPPNGNDRNFLERMFGEFMGSSERSWRGLPLETIKVRIGLVLGPYIMEEIYEWCH